MLWLGFADTNDALPDPAPDPPHDHEDVEEEEYGPSGAGTELIFAALPWLVSFLLHVGVILLAIFIVWSAQTQEDEEEVIVPIARLSAKPAQPMQRSVSKTQTKTKSVSKTRRTLSRKATIQASSSLESKVDTQELSLSQAISAAKASPFQTGIRAGAELEAKFFGTGGNAYRIAYLVDASGSLIDTLPYVILELKRSIGELSEKQHFTVIFFQGEDASEVPPFGLKRANSENKQRVIKWIDLSSGNITPKGLSNPVKALRLALRYKPQLLFILSDNITGEGRYEVDQVALIESITRENRGDTKINTIQFLYPDPLERYNLTPTLELISQNTGGIYKFIDGRELGIE